MVVYTEAVQFKVDSKLVDFIEKKLSKIDQFFDRIINARVVLKLENTGQVREKNCRSTDQCTRRNLICKSYPQIF